MDPVTHVAAGVLISQVLPAPARGWAVVAGMVFALLPDIDYFLVFTDRLAFIRHHRGFTHSLCAIPLFTLLGAAVGRALGGPRWFQPLFLLGLAVLGSHLLLDLATSYGTQILSPFSRRRFTLDWIFIIDPYLTALLVAGAAATWLIPLWGRRVGVGCLAAAGVYLLICGLYHHQALTLAQQVFPEPSPFQVDGSLKPRLKHTRVWQSLRENPGRFMVAALPQPFSCRRWQLLAADPEGIQQTFVALPWLALMGQEPAAHPAQAAAGPNCRAPDGPYQPPDRLTVRIWTAARPAPREYPPEARAILDAFLEFARFPLLHRAESRGEDQILEWRDLRFSVPGRAFPFVLQLRLDPQGRVRQWIVGRGRDGEG